MYQQDTLSKKYIRYIGIILIIAMMCSVMTACGGNKLSNGTYVCTNNTVGHFIFGKEFTVKGSEITVQMLGFTYPYYISDGKIYYTMQGMKLSSDCELKGNTVIIDKATYKKK